MSDLLTPAREAIENSELDVSITTTPGTLKIIKRNHN